MLPLLLITIVEILAGAAAGGAAVAIAAGVLSLIIDSWQGKTIAVLGERGVGKTTLINFLKSGELNIENKQTVSAKKVESKTYKLKDLQLRFNTVDLPGSKDAYNEWKNSLDNADFVLYLLRTDMLMKQNKETESRVRDDFKLIKRWLDDNQKIKISRPKVYLIGTHSDLDQDFPKSNNNSCIGDYQDKFSELPLIKDLRIYAGGKNLVNIILGSMQTKSDAERLVYRLLEQEGTKNG